MLPLNTSSVKVITYHMLFNVGADHAAAAHLDLDGLGQDPTSQRLHGSGEGG